MAGGYRSPQGLAAIPWMGRGVVEAEPADTPGVQWLAAAQKPDWVATEQNPDWTAED